MNKFHKKFSNKSNYLQKSRFVDEKQYQESNKRDDSCESEEFTTYTADENRFLRSDFSFKQNLTRRTKKVVSEINDSFKNSRIKSDGNCSPLKDDRNKRLLYARKQNGENCQQKLSMKSHIYENIDKVDSENNVHLTTKSISRVGQNVLSPERVEFIEVFKSKKEENVNLAEPNHLGISASTEEYSRLGDAAKVCTSNSSVTTQLNRVYSFEDCNLLELLYYNVGLMQDFQLFEYSFALKKKIMEKMLEFEDPEKPELEFLCSITDGTQMQHNQKSITLRMYYVLSRYFEKEASKPKLSNNYPIPSEYLTNCDTTSEIGKECNLGREPDEDVKYKRSIVNATLNNENSVRSSFNTEGISDLRNREQALVPKNSECSSITITNIFGNCSSSNYYVHDDFQRIPRTDSEWTTLNSIQEALENDCSMSTESVSDYMPQYEKSIYQFYKLESLLNCDVNTMHSSSFFEYAFVLKNKVLEKMFEFSDPVKEKLEFLCELTDGTQLEVNQRLITIKLCHLVAISL